MAEALTALVEILTSAVQTLQTTYVDERVSFPSLDDPYEPTSLDQSIAVKETRDLIVAAAAQIIAVVRTPAETLHDLAPAAHMTAALGFVVDTNISDILQGDLNGMHVDDISTINGVDSSNTGKLHSRILRFLATRHVFREVTPNVFTNNRVSSALVKNRSVEAIKADPDCQYDDAPLAAWVGYYGEEFLKMAPVFSSFAQGLHPEASAPFNLVFPARDMFAFYENDPANRMLSRRFASAMAGLHASRYRQQVMIDALDWSSMRPDEVVVDVGGSLGTASSALYGMFPHLRYIIEDLPGTIDRAKEFWAKTNPKAVRDGRVQFQAQDFFQPQIVKKASVYFLRAVIHDWSDSVAKDILRHLRDAAGLTSKLVLFDYLIDPACVDPSADSSQTKDVPWPLLSNLGVSGAGRMTGIDLLMMDIQNGKERTEQEFKDLGRAAGWEMKSIKRGPFMCSKVFLPLEPEVQ